MSGDRTVERLDHAATTVRTAIGAVCRQLQAFADAVAALPPVDRGPAANQIVSRGLASSVIVDAPPNPAWRDCAGPGAGGVAAVVARARAGGIVVTAVQNLDAGFVDRLAASSGAEVTLLAHDGDDAQPAHSTVTARAQGQVAFAAATAKTRTHDGHRYVRRLETGPGQPLPLAVSIYARDPVGLYVLLFGAVLAVAAGAVLVARWLARSTTRPLADLAWAAERVAAGDLNTRVPVLRNDELGRLAGTFNRMTHELQAYVLALTASRDQLRRHLAILGETLSSTHDLDRILQVILQTARSATGARAGTVLLIDPVDNALVARCAEGLTGNCDASASDLATLRIPLGTGVLGAVAATGEARRGICGLGGSVLEEPDCQTYVAVPICAPVTGTDPPGAADESNCTSPATLGVLALYDRLGSDEFDDSDLMTLRTFAGQAGVAVHNVRMHEEAQRLSLTDPLTGLWNYRYLHESLRREVERASRFGRMLTVLVLDLDHFKEVNDTHGHAAGDAVLVEFARRLRAGLREVDLAFRQGGEEFVVLLPETDAYGGAIVAERLGSAIRDIPVPVGRHRLEAAARTSVLDIPITVSIGVAVYPEHGATAQEVLDAADAALYAAKDAGRDAYRLAEPAVPGVPEMPMDPSAAAPGEPQPPRQGRGR